MNREEYNSCVAKGMSGKTFTAEQRKLEFCVVAKLCSGKTGTREEAIKICSEPKEPKEPKQRRSRRNARQIGSLDSKGIKKVATCMVKVLDRDLLAHEDSMALAIANALDECQ